MNNLNILADQKGTATGGTVLGAATMLPATSAVGLIYSGYTNNLVIYGLLTISTLGLVVTIAMAIRYAINRKRIGL